MLRTMSAVSILLLAGCASMDSKASVPNVVARDGGLLPVAAGGAAGDAAGDASGAEWISHHDAAIGETSLLPEATLWSGSADDAPLAFPVVWQGRDKDQRQDRFTLKAGYWGSDEDSLDDGLLINGAWLHFLNKLFAIEVELGYLDADGNNGGVETDAWALPLMLNGRLNVPVAIFDFYGGLGVGTFYYNLAGPVSTDADGWILGGNAFLGADVMLGDSLALGLEFKHYVTEDFANSSEGLEGTAVLLTLGFAH